ncbi:putative sphingomyelin phosphodiesterase 4 isoform X2 [Apostichopus japonicus]|uniref:Putative sphingomyelin phosphodiesterase 4 isoform X2 n=1 Tax=Stichopus japonicus TaxID=307972 RepID=A0A2G8L0T2_STIJA|nr:putative sphingomyelin phosphodiesterase 4 isoform X2 [Apostichopus japonicus]
MERSPLIRDEASSFYHLSSPSSSSSLFNSSSHHGQGATSEGETWRSEVFIQALVDFWLNQNSIASQNKSLFRQVQVRRNLITSSPSLDHVRAVRILIKHLHFFANSAPRDPTPYKQSPETTLNDLKRHILPVLVQKPLYVFLRHGFDHWPLDVSFRQVNLKLTCYKAHKKLSSFYAIKDVSSFYAIKMYPHFMPSRCILI